MGSRLGDSIRREDVAVVFSHRDYLVRTFPPNLPCSTIITNGMQNPQRRHQHIRQPNHQILRLRIVRNHPVQHPFWRDPSHRHPRRRMAGCTVPEEGDSDCPVCGDFCHRDVVDDCCAEGAEGRAFVWVLLGRTVSFVREMWYTDDVCTGLLPRGHNAPRIRLGSAKHSWRYEEEVYVGCGVDWDVCGKCRPPLPLPPSLYNIHGWALANAIDNPGKVIGPQLYSTSQAPLYRPGLISNLILFVLVAAFAMYVPASLSLSLSSVHM